MAITGTYTTVIITRTGTGTMVLITRTLILISEDTGIGIEIANTLFIKNILQNNWGENEVLAV
jgi:hypothetical protein